MGFLASAGVWVEAETARPSPALPVRAASAWRTTVPVPVDPPLPVALTASADCARPIPAPRPMGWSQHTGRIRPETEDVALLGAWREHTARQLPRLTALPRAELSRPLAPLPIDPMGAALLGGTAQIAGSTSRRGGTHLAAPVEPISLVPAVQPYLDHVRPARVTRGVASVASSDPPADARPPGVDLVALAVCPPRVRIVRGGGDTPTGETADVPWRAAVITEGASWPVRLATPRRGAGEVLVVPDAPVQVIDAGACWPRQGVQTRRPATAQVLVDVDVLPWDATTSTQTAAPGRPGRRGNETLDVAPVLWAGHTQSAADRAAQVAITTQAVAPARGALPRRDQLDASAALLVGSESERGALAWLGGGVSLPRPAPRAGRGDASQKLQQEYAAPVPAQAWQGAGVSQVRPALSAPRQEHSQPDPLACGLIVIAGLGYVVCGDVVWAGAVAAEVIRQ